MKKIMVSLVGPLYGFIHFTARHSILGFTLGGWIRFLPLPLILVAFIGRWPTSWIIVFIVLLVLLQLLYWKSKRDGYVRFLADADQNAPEQVHPLVDEEKVSVQATGPFSVKDRETNTLLRPADYWRIPNGDHAIMVNEAPGRFLYQFIEPGSLQDVRSGLLLHGKKPWFSLAISFLTRWGPEFSEEKIALYGSNNNNSPAKMRRYIFLTFASEDERRSVWHNLLRDADQPITRKL